MGDLAEVGIVRVRSRFSVAETMERLRGVLAWKGEFVAVLSGVERFGGGGGWLGVLCGVSG